MPNAIHNFTLPTVPFSDSLYNWLQSRVQVHLCYKFSRCASAASNPTIGDVREINKTLKSQYVNGRFLPLKGSQRILGMPDVSYRKNTEVNLVSVHMSFSSLKTANCKRKTHTAITVI